MASVPSTSDILRELVRGSAQENLTAAERGLKRSRSEGMEFEQGAHEDLDIAIKGYNQALQKADLVGPARVTARLQLGKAHALRAIAEYSHYPQRRTIDPRSELVRHHAEAAARSFESYRRELGDTVAASQKLLGVAMHMVKICDINVDAPHLRYALFSIFGSHLSGAETSGYKGTRLPRVRMEMYIAKQCFLQAVRLLSSQTNDVTPVFVELKQTSMRGEETDDSLLRKWKKVQQQMMQGKSNLVKALHHFAHGGKEDSEVVKELQREIQDVAEQMKFLFQRALVIQRLAFAAEQQRNTLQETEHLDMGACYNVIDVFREAEAVAGSLEQAGVDTSGFENCLKGMDVEMLCIASHLHALLLNRMGFPKASRKKHIFVLCTALSLDPTSSCSCWETPPALLRQKPWFMESKRVVEEAQHEDREAEAKHRQEDLMAVDAELKALSEARKACTWEGGNFDPRPLIKHILEKHPPARAVDDSIRDALLGNDPFKKPTFMKVMALYHPDKLDPDLTKSQKLLFEEIMKVMNGVYEMSYKNVK
jgi:hypothetical protein